MRNTFLILLLVWLNSCADQNQHLLNNKLSIYVPNHLKKLSVKEICDSSHLFIKESPKGFNFLPEDVFFNFKDSAFLVVYYSEDFIPDSSSYILSWLDWRREYIKSMNSQVEFNETRIDIIDGVERALLDYSMPYPGIMSEYLNYGTILNNRFLELRYCSRQMNGKFEKSRIKNSIKIKYK